MRYLAFSAKHDKPVVQTGSIPALRRILAEGEYDLSDITLVACFGTLSSFDWDHERIKTGAQLFSLSVLT